MSNVPKPGSPGHPHGYDELPAAIKQLYSPEQYLWLSDDEKGRLEQTETEPEVEL